MKTNIKELREQIEEKTVKLENFIYGSSYGNCKEWEEKPKALRIMYTDALHDLKHLRNTLDFILRLEE